MRVFFVTRDPQTKREHRILDAQNIERFLHYGKDGAGYGYLTFDVKRENEDYTDLGYGYELVMFKGPFKVLFSGQIVRITQSVKKDGSGMTVWVLGWIHVTGNDRFNRVYCDTRLREWFTIEQADGDLRPNKFNVSTREDVLAIEPRRGIELGVMEYISVFYQFSFGETAKRLTADYQLSIPTVWSDAGGGLTLSVLDGNENELWSSSSNSTGSIDVTGSGGYFEVRLYFSGDAPGASSRNDVFAALGNLRVFSTNETVNAALVARDVVDQLSTSGHGLSDRVDAIEDVGESLEPAVFTEDKTPKEVLSWAAKFGHDGQPLAWGVTFDDTRRLFVEVVDGSSIKYEVPKGQIVTAEQSGDWGQRAQVAYGVYQDMQGRTQRTPDIQNSSAIESLGGYWRREAVQLGGPMTQTQAINALVVWMNENEQESITGTFEVKGHVLTPKGKSVPVDEIVPGGLVRVRGWRAFDVHNEGRDYRHTVTTFPLKGVIIRDSEKTAELVPREEIDAFERQLAIIKELQS